MAAPTVPNWQGQLLRSIGAPATPQNLLFVNDWARAEGGGAANNPFNTTEPGYGTTGNYNSVGVKEYATPQQGIAATAATLENGRYGNILSALRHGTDAKLAAAALAASPWGTGSLVEKMLGEQPTAPAGSPPLATAAHNADNTTPAPVAPQRDYRPQLASELAAAAGTPSNDLTGFYGTLRQALEARRVTPQTPPSNATLSGHPEAPGPSKPRMSFSGLIRGNTQGEQAAFLQDLARLAQYEKAPVDINSGYRSYAKQAALYANRGANPNPVAPPGHSLHEQGLAADGTVNGIPLGTLPAAVLARFGLATVPGDRVHVQVAR
jgi:hypothetical protein